MEKYNLKFPSLIYLSAFRRFSKAKHWEINITNLVAQCDCTEKEAGFACKEFKAVLLDGTEDLDVDNWEMNETSLPRHAS